MPLIVVRWPIGHADILQLPCPAYRSMTAAQTHPAKSNGQPNLKKYRKPRFGRGSQKSL